MYLVIVTLANSLGGLHSNLFNGATALVSFQTFISNFVPIVLSKTSLFLSLDLFICSTCYLKAPIYAV